MSETLEDKNGAPVTVELDEPGLAYVIKVASGAVAGRAHYLVGPNTDTERIFYHTVVDSEFSGHGLSKVLVAQALDDCRERGLMVVPICSVFVTKLQQSGDDYQAEGGRFRSVTGADFDFVEKLQD